MWFHELRYGYVRQQDNGFARQLVNETTSGAVAGGLRSPDERQKTHVSWHTSFDCETPSFAIWLLSFAFSPSTAKRQAKPQRERRRCKPHDLTTPKYPPLKGGYRGEVGLTTAKVFFLWQKSKVEGQTSHVFCPLSHVLYPLSQVVCHMSFVASPLSI